MKTKPGEKIAKERGIPVVVNRPRVSVTVTVKIGGRELMLTEDEARELWKKLNTEFGVKALMPADAAWYEKPVTIGSPSRFNGTGGEG